MSESRVLVLAYECSPRRGSESGAGFAVLSGLVGAGPCTVLVGGTDAAALESWSNAHPELAVTVERVDDSRLGAWLYRLHHYTQFVAYLLWLRRATPRLRALAATGAYDVAWHATYSPAWLPSPLRHLTDIATVWGPCTGADRVPRSLRWSLARKSRARDNLDNLTTWAFAKTRSTRASVRSVDLMLLALDNPWVRRLRDGETEVFVQTTLVDVGATHFAGERGDYLCYTSALRAQKGPVIAVEAAARNERVRLVVAPPAKGQMRDEVERVVRAHGAAARIQFVDGLSREQMLELLARSKGFVHSAVSDAASMALAEALVLGVPVVALDVPGSRTMKECMNQPAYLSLVPAAAREEVIAGLANEMGAMLDRDDFPDRPLLDQTALRDQFGSYVDRARSIHERRRKSGARNAARRRVVQLMYMVQDRGGETVAHQLARGFRERGYEMRNIGVYREVPETSTTADFEILYGSRPSLVANLGCFFRLVRLLRRERPEAVIMHGDFAQVIGAPAAFLAGVRQRVVINHLALGITKRWLRAVHAALGTIGLYRHIVFVGESARRSADGLPRPFVDRSVVIPNTVDIERGSRASARARFGVPDDAIVVLNVGSLTHQKNQMLLIEALAFLPEAMLVIVGDGPLEDYYRTASARYGNRVRLLGRVPSEEMGDVYAMADVFVFPSHYEGRPLALLEAVTCGLPIVASPIAENVEVLGAAAHYVPSGDLSAWIAALRAVVEDSQFREGLRRQTETVDKGCTESTIESYIGLLSK